MRLTVGKSVLNGRVAMPGSKSHTIRAVAVAILAEGESEIVNPLVSADTAAAVRCYGQLGAQIECGGDVWRVKGTAGAVGAPDDVIDVGNSGTTLRFALGSAALLGEGAAVFTGDEQTRRRPVGPLLASLDELGAKCLSTRLNGRAPIVVQGKMTGGATSIEAVTSQYVSSLLLNAPLAKRDTAIHVTKLNERPYVEMTLAYLDEQQISYENDGMEHFVVRGGQGYAGFSKRIPADFSSATFFLCAGAMLDGRVVLEGLDFTDPQGDKAVVDILRQMGARIEIDGSAVHVSRDTLKGVSVDLNATPDALCALAVAACFADGASRFYNVAQARLKETDRIAVMAQELGKLGAKVTEQPDGLTIEPAKLHAADLCGHDDHRVVMALSLAAMAIDGTCTIDGAEAIAVTFGNYVELMQALGADMRIVDQ